MRFERLRRTVVYTVVITLLFAGVATPRPARAVDTAVLVIGSIAAYVAFVAAGTYLMRRNSASTLGMDLMEAQRRNDQLERGIHLAPRCRQTAAGLTLVCW